MLCFFFIFCWCFFFFFFFFFFFNDTATTEIYTLSLHDALPFSVKVAELGANGPLATTWLSSASPGWLAPPAAAGTSLSNEIRKWSTVPTPTLPAYDPHQLTWTICDADFTAKSSAIKLPCQPTVSDP